MNKYYLQEENKNVRPYLLEEIKLKFTSLHHILFSIIIIMIFCTIPIVNKGADKVNLNKKIENSKEIVAIKIDNPKSSGIRHSDYKGSVVTVETGHILNKVRLFRLRKNQDYILTTDINEGSNEGYTYEGVVGYVSSSKTLSFSPCYRFYNRRSNDHFFSLNEYEGINAGYVTEGVTWYISKYKSAGFITLIPLYQFFNGTNHFYSTDLNEGVTNGYRYEKILGYIIPSKD